MLQEILAGTNFCALNGKFREIQNQVKWQEMERKYQLS